MARSWYEAREIVHAHATPLPPDVLPLARAADRILVEDLVARTDVPHYSSSAMDGWAVTEPAPWRLTGPGPLTPGHASPIVTGGLLPPGARAVVRTEYGCVCGDLLSLGPTADPGEVDAGRHIRSAGEEARRGERVATVGQMLNPARLALLAACGHDRVPVQHVPSIAAVVTGNELVAGGIPSAGHVRDAFSPALAPLLGGLGAHLTVCSRVGDTRQALVEAVGATDCDVIVTTGGTGVSAADHLRAAVSEVGGTLIVDRVAVRPGGPTVVAHLGDGRLLLGLPGNPLAAFLSALGLLPPIVAGLTGGSLPELGTVHAAAAIEGKPGYTRLVPCQLTDTGSVVPLGWQGAAMMRGLADADVVVVCPPSGVTVGDEAPTLGLPWRVSKASQISERRVHGGVAQ